MIDPGNGNNRAAKIDRLDIAAQAECAIAEIVTLG